MKDIIISCIISIYNTAKYVDKCLMSIINQKQLGIQIVLVDDGSTDDSSVICDRYKAIYPDLITVIHKQNEGVSQARNVGVQYAKGDFIWFIDSDDYLEEGAFEKIIPHLSRETDIYETGYRIHNVKSGEKIILPILSSGPINPLLYLKDSLRQYAYDWYPWRFIIKKTFFLCNDFAFPKGRNFEDIYLIPRIILNANTIFPIAEVTYNYIQGRSGAITTDVNLKKEIDLLWAVSNIAGFIQSISDLELRSLLLNNVVRMYYSPIMDYCRLKNKNDRKELLAKLIEHKELMNYTISGKQRLIRLSIRLIGIRATAFLLDFQLKLLGKIS